MESARGFAGAFSSTAIMSIPPQVTPDPPPSVTDDRLYLAIVAVFAVLTTAVGAAVGSALLLAVLQSATLWVLALPAFRQRSPRKGALILTVWCALQFLTFLSAGVVFLDQAEKSVVNGFLYREALLEWLYTASALPASWADQRLARAAELVGVTVGAMISAGLLGICFLVRMVNLYAFGLATLAQAAGGLNGIVFGLAPWMLLRIAGSILSIAVFGQVVVTGEWLPTRWPAGHRKLMWIGLGLLLASTAQ